MFRMSSRNRLSSRSVSENIETAVNPLHEEGSDSMNGSEGRLTPRNTDGILPAVEMPHADKILQVKKMRQRKVL